MIPNRESNDFPIGQRNGLPSKTHSKFNIWTEPLSLEGTCVPFPHDLLGNAPNHYIP